MKTAMLIPKDAMDEVAIVFVAIVEFGKKLKAQSIVSGGQSSDPNSPHFTDQAELFCKGDFKDVLYYKEDVLKHKVRTYRPGK